MMNAIIIMSQLFQFETPSLFGKLLLNRKKDSFSEMFSISDSERLF